MRRWCSEDRRAEGNGFVVLERKQRRICIFKILQRISLRAFLASFYYPVYSRVLLDF